jgi:hypothetical protein
MAAIAEIANPKWRRYELGGETRYGRSLSRLPMPFARELRPFVDAKK